MSSLYRCRARVGYRPFRSDKLIVFDERQVQELTVDLKWEPGPGVLNSERITTPSAATNALGQSKCSVTISDPYLTGLAWPVLYDAASIYTASNIAAANNILLPECGENQDPVADKCFKSVDLETDSTTGAGGDFAFLIISLWYEVAGTSFGTDFYFRVGGFAVSHGSKYPSVTIRGVEARSVLFNQSLVNMTFDEGAEIEKVLKDIAEQSGYSVSFCANTNEFPEKKRLLPRSIRFKGVTPDEAINRVISSVSGNTHSMPTREYANKISMCTRAELNNQGCSVFYLGKGLYESYEINGQPDLTLLTKNQELSSNLNNGDPYRSEAFNAQTYVIQDITPKRRKEAMKGVKKIAFPKLFDKVTPHIRGASRVTSGFVWKDSRPASNTSGGKVAVINERVKDTNLYGIAPNGIVAISFLDGDVKEASESQGRVLINTRFGFRICKPDDSKKCFHRQIRQESTGLNSVKVKIGDKVKINQEIGSSTADKPEFTRFFIDGYGGEQVTLNPQLVWDWAIPEGEIKSLDSTSAPVSGNPQQATTPPPSGSQAFSGFVGRVGNTGRSDGSHLHVESVPRTAVTEAQLDDLVSKYVEFPGKSRGRGFFGHGYPGIDYPAPEGSPITILNGAFVSSVEEVNCRVGDQDCGGKFGNHLIIQTPEGVKLLLAHLKESSVPPNIAGLRSSSGGGKHGPNMQASPSTSGLTIETGFKGIPRSLRIIPGKTILSFITDYDEWVENGGPRGQDNGRDPGVWIPRRFSNWFITHCGYKWRDGDLRVDLEARSAWGTRKINVPTFTNYLTEMQKSGDIKSTSDYYGYIRSIGDLQWKIEEDGKMKDSTEVNCPEAQWWAENSGATQGSDSTNPNDVQNSFPAANCRTGNATQDAIINALYSAGLKTPNAFAGALGNLQEESGFDPNVHNTSKQGFTCRTDSSNPPAGRLEKCYGLVQWGGERKVRALQKCGQVSTLQCQLGFMVQEIRQRGGGLVEDMNNARSASTAAEVWRRKYEVASGGIQKRQQFAQQIVKQIKCDRPSQ